MNPPLIISILMPVKNTALFLNECLDSIVNQNELNFELIAIDDHSTDESYSILYNYSNKPRKKIYLINNYNYFTAMTTMLMKYFLSIRK